MGETTIFMIIAAAGTLVSIYFAFFSNNKASKNTCKEEGEEEGSLKADTQYIKRRIDDVLLEQKDTNKSINALSERVTRVEESAKQAHKRLDRLGEE